MQNVITWPYEAEDGTLKSIDVHAEDLRVPSYAARAEFLAVEKEQSEEAAEIDAWYNKAVTDAADDVDKVRALANERLERVWAFQQKYNFRFLDVVLKPRQMTTEHRAALSSENFRRNCDVQVLLEILTSFRDKLLK